MKHVIKKQDRGTEEHIKMDNTSFFDSHILPSFKTTDKATTKVELKIKEALTHSIII